MDAWFEIRIYYIKSWTHDLKSIFIISNHERMIWNQGLLYQILNIRFEIRIYYLKSWTYMYDLKSGFIISNHKLMIWNQGVRWPFQSVSCPSYGGVRLIESLVIIKWLRSGWDQHQVSVLQRCLSYRGVC